MTKHIGGTDVKAGFYWNLKKWEITALSGNGGTLPGAGEDRFIKVPMLAFLFIAPVMGGLYAFFLPFIGFAMVFAFLGRKVAAGLGLAKGRVGEVVGPDWQPGEAYLAGRRGKDAKKEDAKNTDKTEKV